MVQLFLQLIQWRRRWRTLQHQCSAVPWVFLIVSLVVQQTSAYHYHHNPPPPSPHSPAMLVQQYQNPQQAQPQSHSLLTGPSVMPPNYYYTIDSGNKLAQRQMPPGPSGITAAATNYLLQQLEIEKQQQHPHHRAMAPQQAPQLSQNQQALQLLANLTPRQLTALQNVIPTLPRSRPGPQPMASATTNNAAGAVAVLPPPSGMESGHPHPQSSFSSRMGPFDKLFSKAKSWLPDMMSAGSSHVGSKSGGNGIGEPKMRDLHRLPKPPQYPLYDLPSLGLATPPPAPIMHPMASLPNSAFDLDQPPISPPMQSSSPRSAGLERSDRNGGSGFNQQNWMSPSPTMSTKRRSHRPTPQRPPKPSRSSFLKNTLQRYHKKSRPSSEPPSNYNRRNHGPPLTSGRQPPHRGGSRQRNPSLTTKPKKNGPPKGRHSSNGRRPPSPPGPSSDPFGAAMGFEYPMASNLSPAQSPSLGRPLNYEEYMARPSHSYTDDPWNFDPFANQMNQGLHTNSLRYNYDPLGMNALDTEANSHLDPNKLSYPGDSFNQDMVKDSPGIQGTSQMGGWDKPFKKRPYDSDPELELTPPGTSAGYGSSSSSFSSSPNDPFQPPSSFGSSSNRYKKSGSSSSSSGGNEFLGGDALTGGRRGEIPSMDHLEGGSALPSFGGDQGNQDGAPTIDSESLSNQDEDGMSGLEFTIETSRDNDAGAEGGRMEESPQPDPHPLGPMQPAPNPYLSDQYNPYGEQSAPVSFSVPGNPYGPGGYRPERERYGRRRTRNNHGQAAVGRRSLRTRAHKQRSVAAPSSQQPSSSVPEGVQIFNEIIRPQLVQSSAQIHPQHAALRRQLYNAIRQSARK